MAAIRPFRAVMPAHEPGDDVTLRVSPPYDVVSPDEREAFLASDAHNVVALELPEGSLDPDAPGNRYETGGARWRDWLDRGVLVTDDAESLYVMEQRFELGGREVRRRSLVAAVGLVPFEAGVVLPHERTLPKALGDRMHLLRATDANLSPVFGMFSDPEGATDSFFEDAMRGEPIMRSADADGVETRVWSVSDPGSIAAIQTVLADRAVFIADGHHRYTTALAYSDEKDGPGEHDAVLMALVNMDDPNLIVLAAHRVTRSSGDFVPEAFRSALSRWFDLRPLEGPAVDAVADSDRIAFVVRTPADGQVFLARLKDGVETSAALAGDQSAAWKDLDVAVLQELILDPLLDIHPDRPETLERLEFVKDADRALTMDDRDAVFILRPTRMDQLREVAVGGEIMPQKSTYFYPKVPSGLLMRSVR